METLQTNITPDNPQFKQNAAHHRALADELRERLNTANQGGGTKYRVRHEEQGKLFVYDRIDRLLDPGAPFLNSRRWQPMACTMAGRMARASSPASGASAATRS